MFYMFVGTKLLYWLYNYKSAQQDADDRDEELDLEESLDKTNFKDFKDKVLKILIQKARQECGSLVCW